MKKDELSGTETDNLVAREGGLLFSDMTLASVQHGRSISS
jgi:hypothetical protein